MNVDVYWNKTKGCYSIRHRGLVVGHASKVLIREPRYAVNTATRDRIRETGRKEVHAFVRGHLEAWKGETTAVGDRFHLAPLWLADDRRYEAFAGAAGQFVSYNPLNDDAFKRTATGQPITHGEMVLMTRVPRKRVPALLDFDPLQMPMKEIA